jgi:uncharacterized protein (DUF433 family)
MNDRIVIDPQICHGKSTIRGSRVPVVRILGYLASGMSADDVRQDFGVSTEDVQAAMEYAADSWAW